MMYKLYAKIFVAVLFVLVAFSTKAQYVNRIDGSPYPGSRRPDTLYIVDDTKTSPARQLVMQSLQGLLAEYKPRIYRLTDTGSLMWLSELHSRYGVYMIDSFRNDYLGLVSRFSSQVDGYILCSMQGPSANAALSLCIQYNAIVVPEELESNFSFLKRVADTRNMTEEDVYARFHDSLSRSVLVYQKEANIPYLGDYTVFANAFRFYEPVGNTFTQAVFKDMQSNAALFGWSDEERELVRAASKNSVMVHQADYASNLSVLTNIDADYDQREGNINLDTTNPNVQTVCFLMTGGEDINWLLQDFATSPKWYNADDRGSIPLGWTISPALSELAPPVMKYLYDNASNSPTGRDYFVAAPSGLGYLFPDLYPQMLSNTELLDKYMKKADMSIVNVIGNPRSPDLANYAQCKNVDAVFYYMFSDYAGWKGKIIWSNDKPIIGGRYALWGERETPQSLAQKINESVKNQFQPEGYSLIPVHSGTNSVEDVKKCIAMLGGDVRVVAPDDFVRLIKYNLGTFLYPCMPNPVTDKTTFSFKLSFAQHVTLDLLDETGDVLKNLYDGDAEAGITKVDFFRVAEISKGIYMCRMTTPFTTQAIKFTIY